MLQAKFFHPTTPSRTSSLEPVSTFLILAFGISWGVWALRFAFRDTAFDYPLTLMMKFGPSVAGVVVTALVFGAPGVRDLARRTVRWRIAPRWYAIALLGPVVMFAVAIAAYTAFGGRGVETASWVFPDTLVSLGSLIAIRFFAGGGLGEELGWRGFLLPVLQERVGPVQASITIGLWHGFWHLPAYGLGGAMVLTVFTVAMAVVATWMYNGSGGSVFIVALMHAAFNAFIKWIEIVAPGLDNQFGWVALAILLAVVIGVVVGRRIDNARVAVP